jgi:hypothetical protein
LHLETLKADTGGLHDDGIDTEPLAKYPIDDLPLEENREKVQGLSILSEWRSEAEGLE